MKTRSRNISILIILAFAAVACGSGSVSERPIKIGSIHETYAFDAPGDLTEGLSASGLTSMFVTDGQYYIQAAEQGVAWAQVESDAAEAVHDDVVIEVHASLESSVDDALYGVMCRADLANDGDGYIFAISLGGRYFVLRGEDDEYKTLKSGDLPVGLADEGVNVIRAVCIDDYLAMYVNDRFLVALRDKTYASGLAGVAAAPGDGDVSRIVAAFDDLTVYDVSLAE